jgi:diketogulonate reductase-like aldo/keto reductase
MDAKVKRTKVTSKNAYLDERCSKCNGKTVQECLKLEYRKPNGQKAKYTLADLRYDVKGKRLEVVGGAKPKKTAATLLGRKSVPPMAAFKTPAAATSVAGGVRLASGCTMPVVGFGTYKLKNHEVAKPVLSALKAGYRLIDTAQVYENEKGVGEALRKSGLARSDVFIETKVWRSSHGYDRTMKAFKQSCRNLGVDYIDLYVIHWPGCKTGWPLKKGTMCPPDWTPKMRDTGTWRAMEDLYKQGKVKAIGVTNYSIRHLQLLMKSCSVKPMVNQFEFHPRLVQSEMLDFCRKHGIAVQAYASLGSGDAAQAESFFAFPPVCAAAKSHKVTPAQVLLRWAVQKGCHVVPKSVREERVAENKGIFGFKLSAGEMKAIDKLHNGTRFAWKGLDPDTIK